MSKQNRHSIGDAFFLSQEIFHHLRQHVRCRNYTLVDIFSMFFEILIKLNNYLIYYLIQPIPA